MLPACFFPSPCRHAAVLASLVCDLNRTESSVGTVTIVSIKKISLPLNLIGARVRELRDSKGWTQEDLSTKLQVFGWDVSRESLAKLETQQRRVPDGELFILAKVLGTTTDALFVPNIYIKKLGPAFRMRLSRNRVKSK